MKCSLFGVNRRKASTSWKFQICKNRGFSMEVKHHPVGLELVDHIKGLELGAHLTGLELVDHPIGLP